MTDRNDPIGFDQARLSKSGSNGPYEAVPAERQFCHLLSLSRRPFWPQRPSDSGNLPDSRKASTQPVRRERSASAIGGGFLEYRCECRILMSTY